MAGKMLGQGQLQTAAMGQLGSDYINDTEAHTNAAGWGIIYCTSACTFTTLTSGNDNDGNVVMSGTLNDITLAAGMVIYGLFTAITLASGKVIAYKV